MFKTATILALLLAGLLGATTAKANYSEEGVEPLTCRMIARPGGVLTFMTLLPSGQAYVELFSRQNGVLNVARPVQLSEEPVAEGLSLYSFEREGYLDGDVVECRIYYYQPASPGMFGPGPSPDAWEETVYREPNEAPSAPEAAILDLGDGTLRFEALLPSGQAYVAMIARVNGVQNLAEAVQLSEVALGNGWSSYSLEQSGYSSGDQVDLRVFSYLPASPGVFTPSGSDFITYMVP